MRTTVRLALFESGADALRLDHLGRQLRSDLLHLDAVADVTVDGAADPAANPAANPAADATVEPAPVRPVVSKTRGIDAATASTLAVALLGSGGITAVIGTLREWLNRGGADAGRTVRLEAGGDVLELTGASPAEQERLVALFLRRLDDQESP